MWAPEVAKEPLSAFFTLFSRPVCLDGRVFYDASKGFVREVHMAIAKAKGMPETQPNGNPWPSKLLMSNGVRARVREWEAKLSFLLGCFLK